MSRPDAPAQADLLRLARQRAAGAARPTAVPRGAGSGPAPLSHAQRRMWLMDRLGQGGALYNVPVATRLRGPLDTDALAEALGALTDRHRILRTRYGQRGDEPFQEVAQRAPVAVPVLAATPDETPAVLLAEASRPFDLTVGPMLRAVALRHGPQDHTVLLTLHHIAVDGGSLPVVLEELAVLYAAARAGRPAELPEPALQYADFARWERSRADELARAVDDWAARLAGARPVPLPRLAPTGRRTRTAGTRSVPLSVETLDGLRQLGRRQGATPFTVVLAAAFATLHRATGRTDLTLGCVSGHRARPELRRLVGLCVNTLPIRADLGADPAFTELLGRVRGALLGAQAQHEVPFDLVVERLGPDARGADGTALLSVTCDLVQRPGALDLPGLAAETVDVDLGLAKFDLGLFVEDGPQPRCLVQYDADALHEQTAEQLLDAFAELLTAVAADGGQRLGRLPGRALRPVAADVHPAEAALLADPRIAEAVVVLRAGLPPLAYAVPAGPAAPSGTELRGQLRSRLSGDRLPAAVTVVDRLPRDADGAVDLTRLPGNEPPKAPRPPAEGARVAAVRTAFGELLSARPGPEDDFFALGGHSLVAVQLAERLRTATGLPLTGLDILEQRTPRAVAALLDARQGEQRAAAARRAGRAARGVRAGTVLLTGATGGVGAAVLAQLLAQGRPVRALARPESAHLVALEGVDVAEGDLGDLDSLRAAVEGVDAVIHAASTFTTPEVDVAAMGALVDGWRRGSFVFVSSVDAYGRPAAVEVADGAPTAFPVTAYGQGKLDCERILREAAGARGRGGASAVRAPIVWGPEQRLRDQLRWGSTGALYQAALVGRPLPLPDPAAHPHDWYGAAWVHSAALARAVIHCADAPAGGVVNAVSGHVGWPEFAVELARLLRSASAVQLGAQADGELLRPWHYRSDALAGALRERPGEDWRSVLAAMVG
ncbi:condensation domain-containing protein [Kitasatospora mediocidica]|uniref:condensation domain-containing protein n=1 Tax=Kitasatospora mediocidica TaxID=58352 RepID=UPI00056A0AF3|nr:condensation domain-containing protein [Kitasatospora mediocidica]